MIYKLDNTPMTFEENRDSVLCHLLADLMTYTVEFTKAAMYLNKVKVNHYVKLIQTTESIFTSDFGINPEDFMKKYVI